MDRVYFSGLHKHLPIELEANDLPSPILNLPSDILFFDQGWNFCIFATRLNEWYGYGNNSQGQMDIRNEPILTSIFIPLHTFQEIKPLSVQCTHDTTIILSSDRFIYATGGKYGPILKKLIFTGKILRFTISTEKIIAIPEGTGVIVFEHATEVPTVLCNDISFVDVSGGVNHFLALSSNDVPYSCTFSQRYSAACGRSHYPKEGELAPIKGVPKIQRVFACGRNSFLMDPNGRLWVAGENLACSLGIKTTNPVPNFIELPLFTHAKIRQISGDNSSTFLITENAELFGCGEQSSLIHLHNDNTSFNKSKFQKSTFYRSCPTFVSFKYERLLVGTGMKKVLVPTRISSIVQNLYKRDVTITPAPSFSLPDIYGSSVLSAGDNSSQLLIRDGDDSLAVSSRIPSTLCLIASTKHYTIYSESNPKYYKNIHNEKKNHLNINDTNNTNNSNNSNLKNKIEPNSTALISMNWYVVTKERPNYALELVHYEDILTFAIDIVGLHHSVLIHNSDGSLLSIGVDFKVNPNLVPTPSGVTKVSGYGETYAALLANGGIFFQEVGEHPIHLYPNLFFKDISVGINSFVVIDEYGTAYIYKGVFSPIRPMKPTKFVSVGCTIKEITLTNEDGHIFICNWKGVFRDPGEIKNHKIARLVTDFVHDATFAITKSGKIWCKGSNDNCLLMMKSKDPVLDFKVAELTKDHKIASFFSSSGRIFLLIRQRKEKPPPPPPPPPTLSLQDLSSFQKQKDIGVGPYGVCFLMKTTESCDFKVLKSKYRGTNLSQMMSKKAFTENCEEKVEFVVIKFLKKTILNTMSPDQKVKFVHTLDPLTKGEFQHRYLLPYLGVLLGDNISSPGIVTEYMKNGTLEDILNQIYNKRDHFLWSTTRRVIFAVQIAEAMSHLHDSTNMAHGNLYPGNIFIDDEYNAVVGDFGLLRADELVGIYPETKRESPPMYLAPELYNQQNSLFDQYNEIMSNRNKTPLKGQHKYQPKAEDFHGYSKEADVFAYGIILYELIEGVKPFHELKKGASIILAMSKGKRPLFLADTRPLAADLISKCWSHKPSQRPTFKQILSYLKEKNYDLLPNVDFVSVRNLFQDIVV